MRALLLPLGLVGAIACTACTVSADDPPQNGEGPFVTLNGGSFDKLTLNPLDGAGKIDFSAPGTGDALKSRFVAYVEDRNSICSMSANRQGAVVLRIEVTSDNPTFGPGTYTPNVVSIGKSNATCGSEQSFSYESGTVTIATVTATVVTGSFDVTLANGDGTLKGSFNIPLCPGLKLDSCDP